MIRMAKPKRKRLPDDGKLTSRVPPVVRERFGVLLERLKREPWRYRGRKLGIEGLVAAIVVESMDWPEARLRDVLARRLPELEALWAAYEAAQGVSPRIPEPPGGVVEGVRVTGHNDAAAEMTAGSDVQVERGGEAV